MAREFAALSEMELPPLPLEEWEDTKETLHRYCQIVGKTRMELSPFRNHWWHVTLYVSPRGLSTGPIPFAAGAFEATLDLLESRLMVTTSENTGFDFSIEDLPVGEFYSRFFVGLESVGIEASINATPFDTVIEVPELRVAVFGIGFLGQRCGKEGSRSCVPWPDAEHPGAVLPGRDSPARRDTRKAPK